MTLNRMQRIHCELEFAVGIILNQEDHRRDHDGDDTDRSTEAVVRSYFGEVCIVDDDRECPIAFTDQ